MKKQIRLLPLAMGILMLLFSGYVYYKVDGFRLFSLNSGIGIFYVSTYKYTAIIGTSICLAYIAKFISKLLKKSKGGVSK